MQTSARILTFMMLGMFFCLHAARAERINDETLKFSLTIPDGFTHDPQLAQAHPDFVHAFRKSDAQSMGVMIIVERMRGTLGRERLDASVLPDGFAGKVLTVRWRDFEINALEVPEESDGIKIVNYNVQVPLKPEAIQIRVTGRHDNKDELLKLTNGLLQDLHGQSNWLPSTAPQGLVQSRSYGWIILAIVATIVIVGLIVLWKVRRRSRRGTVLGLAIVIYAASFVNAPGDTSEMRGIVGAVRMLGFLGLLLGLYDLIRHPTAKRLVEPVPAADK